MPRRNLYLLLAVAVVSLVCYQKAQRNRYAQIVGDVMDEVQRRYVEPVQGNELFERAVEGILGHLDEYSGYLSPKTSSDLDETLSQQFGGIGVQITIDPQSQRWIVFSPIAGSPADEAGIRAGDEILKIDGQSTLNMPAREVHELIRGKPGDAVVLTVRHADDAAPREVKLVRTIIHVPSVLGDTRQSDGKWNFWLAGHERIGYVRIETFGAKTATELEEVLKQLTARPLRGLILDVRDDPGGLMDAAIDVCRLFVDKGVILTTRGRGGQIRKTYDAQPPHTVFTGFPMAVLVNKSTASASEIVAACLQDHGRAVIIGQRTWGKGVIQELVPLGQNRGAMRLTTASYWRPSGRNIQRTRTATDKDDWGVLPDKGYEVVVNAQEQERWWQWRKARDSGRPAAEAKSPAKTAADGPPTAQAQPAAAQPAAAQATAAKLAAAKPPPKSAAEVDGALAADRPLVKAVEYIEQLAQRKPRREDH